MAYFGDFVWISLGYFWINSFSSTYKSVLFGLPNMYILIDSISGLWVRSPQNLISGLLPYDYYYIAVHRHATVMPVSDSIYGALHVHVPYSVSPNLTLVSMTPS